MIALDGTRSSDGALVRVRYARESEMTQNVIRIAREWAAEYAARITAQAGSGDKAVAGTKNSREPETPATQTADVVDKLEGASEQPP
jgi:hypothetical protein